MKKIVKRLLSLSPVLLIVIAFAVAVCNSAKAAEGAQVKLTKIEGKVTVRAPGGTTWAAAVEGMTVAEGTSVRTGPESKVFITWKSGHTVMVHPLSNITVAKLGSSAAGAEENSISLTEGKVFSRAQKLTVGSSFTVKTPTAVAGVRGSAWETGLAPDNSTSVSVVEGSATLEAGGVEIVVDENFQSDVSSDPGATPGEPEAIPESELAVLQQDNSQTEEAGAAATFEEGATGKTEEKEAVGEEAEGVANEVNATGDVADIVMEQVINDVIDIATEQGNIDTGAIELDIR